MGDVGSLSLGGALGMIAVLAKHELLLMIIGGLFVIETLSVIVQVVSFKLTGKRVFRMAPLHHHFEEKGWQEPKVIVRFWIIAITLGPAQSQHPEAPVNRLCSQHDAPTCPYSSWPSSWSRSAWECFTAQAPSWHRDRYDDSCTS